MVRETSSGLWSPIGDVDALMANIAALRADPARAAAMGRSAREAMERRFTIQAATREYLRVVDLAAAEREVS
jgi:glycosyltransferase involved in cell wall biosynthesis